MGVEAIRPDSIVTRPGQFIRVIERDQAAVARGQAGALPDIIEQRCVTDVGGTVSAMIGGFL
jgi:hypothetical protein